MNKWATIPKIKIDLAHTIDENIEKNEEIKKYDQFSLTNSKFHRFLESINDFYNNQNICKEWYNSPYILMRQRSIKSEE